MAVRWSGEVRVSVMWNDRGYYHGTISWPSSKWSRKLRASQPVRRHYAFSGIGAPKSLARAFDSPTAYTSAAHAAISFALEDLAEEDAREVEAAMGWDEHGGDYSLATRRPRSVR